MTWTLIATTFASSIDVKMPTLILATLLVLAWAIYLPFVVRDPEQRKLPPNVKARLLIVFLYALIFVALVAAFAVGGKKAIEFFDPTRGGLWHNAFQYFEGEAPLLAVTTLALPHSFRFFREIESGLVVWLHSALYFKSDVQALSLHLRKCSFAPTAGERESNISYLREFDVYVEDSDPSVRLESVIAWRKTSTLLRLLRLWNDGHEDVLDKSEMILLDELERAHARKTRLAMDIIRMIRHQEQGARGAVPAEAFGRLALMLASASHVDRSEVGAVEDRLKEILSTTLTPAIATSGTIREPGAMHLSSRELQHHLAQIDSYFRVEYALLLERASELAAKSIVHAGDDAPVRLETMKSVGFGQLGRVETINFDRILWVFFAVSLLGFLLYFYWAPASGGGMRVQADILSRIVLVTSLATLTGAIFGSSRSLASRPATPWTAYIAAGLISVGFFVAVHGTAFLLDNVKLETTSVDQSIDRAGPAISQPEPAAAPSMPSSPPQFKIENFASMLPFAVSPFFIAVAICWLARQKSWPRPSFAPIAIWERTIDGLVLGAVMALGTLTAFTLHQAFDTEIWRVMQNRLGEAGATGVLGLIKFSPAPALGFLIGAIVVRDVRTAAHAQLTNSRALEDWVAYEAGVSAQSTEPAPREPGHLDPVAGTR